MNNFKYFTDNPFWFNSSDYYDSDDDKPTWWGAYGDCPLMNLDTVDNQIRITGEIILLIGAFGYILAALREMRFLGYKMFIENLVSQSISYVRLYINN